MSKIAGRAGWFLLAMMFVFTSLALSVVVVWQVAQQNKANKTAAEQAVETAKATQPAKCSVDQALKYDIPSTPLQDKQLPNFTPVKTSLAHLECVDIAVGTGNVAKIGSTITAHYVGALKATGKVFQASSDNQGQPFSTQLSSDKVIPGWVSGLQGMKPGGIRRLEIPASQAYGAQAQQGIPANSDLVFDITLIAVN